MISDAEFNALKEQVNRLLIHLPALDTARGMGQLTNRIKIKEVDVYNGTLLARVSQPETIAGQWTFLQDLIFQSGITYKGIFHHINTADRTYQLPDKSGILLDSFKAIAMFQNEPEVKMPNQSVIKQFNQGDTDSSNYITKKQFNEQRLKSLALGGG